MQSFACGKFRDSNRIEGFGDGVEGLFSGHGNRVRGEEGKLGGFADADRKCLEQDRKLSGTLEALEQFPDPAEMDPLRFVVENPLKVWLCLFRIPCLQIEEGPVQSVLR